MFLEQKYNINELIKLSKAGERKAQELLYKQFASKMLAVCARYATDRMEAEDMLQNGFIRVFQKIGDFRDEGSFEGWVRRIMVHCSIEYYRKHHKMMQAVDMDEADEPSVDPMAMANLYGYGKLAWNPDDPLEKIIDTWTRLTWGNDPQVVRTIDAMQLQSWHVYESYTGPNGMGTLTNILGYHFGPGIESAERNGWGQWFRGEKDGIGMDRTVATGTGYIGQYPKELAEKYESLTTCPDDLLLFFHHVPYDYKLHSGKTLVQSIYDSHYEGALAAAEYVPQWESLKSKIDPERYEKTHALFEYQAGHAIVWRDAINNWFHRISGIDDAQGRVGHHSNRIEAESMKTGGYQTVEVTPWETSSDGKAVECHEAKGCTLTITLEKPAGTYDLAVQYFDIWRGVSTYTLSVNGAAIATWKSDDTLPPAQPDPHLDGQTSTRRTIRHVALKPGDVLELRGVPDLRLELFHGAQAAGLMGAQGLRMQPNLQEYAPVDYIEIGPDGPITPQ